MNKKYLIGSLVVLIIILVIFIAVFYSDIYLLPDKTPSIACGYWHSFVLDLYGNAYACGANWNGQLGNGTRIGTSIPKRIQGIDNLKMIACGSNHTIAVKKDGTVWVWGNNYYGQLGVGNTKEQISPVKITALDKVRQVSCGDSFSVAVKEDGTVWAWGKNECGQRGNGNKTNCHSPVQVLGLSGIKKIACGSQHVAAVKYDGTVWMWGQNNNGQLGDGTLVSQTTASIIMGLVDVDSVSCGASHTIALKSNGKIYVWGSNANGQLGIKNMKAQNTPVLIDTPDKISAIACGYSHSIALKSDGKVLCWGGETYLGDGSSSASNQPVVIDNIPKAAQIYANNNYSIAVSKDGGIFAWGKNWKGQLGNGTTTDNITPAPYMLEADKNQVKQLENIHLNYFYCNSNGINFNKNEIDQKQWGLKNIGQIVEDKKGVCGIDINIEPAWEICGDLKPCIVGIIDSGVDINHQAIEQSIYINKNEIPNNGIDDDNNGFIDDINGWDFYNNNNSIFDSTEKDSHGTSVGGIISANAGTNNGTIPGIAPNARLLPLKVTEDGVDVNITNVIKAIEYLKMSGVEIINCSFGTTEQNHILENILKDTKALFISAAGNNGVNVSSMSIYPACFYSDNVLSVASICSSGDMDLRSNYGDKIDIAAPGVNIYTTKPGNKYGYFSGTSAAVPFVTGVAALLKGKYPNITYLEIRKIIIDNVNKLDSLKGEVSSSGIVDAYRVLTYNKKLE